MPETENYYIDKVVHIAERFCNNDIDEYEELINVFFTKQYNICTERDLCLFSEIFSQPSLPDNLYIKYNSRKNAYKVCNSKPAKWTQAECYAVKKEGNRVSIFADVVQQVLKRNSKVKAANKVDSCAKTLKAFLKKESECSDLVTCINELDENVITKFFQEKISYTFFLLLKSLMVGEYVILDDYSEKLRIIRELNIETTSDLLNSFLSGLQSSCFFIESACSTLSSAFKAKKVQYTIVVGGVWGHHKHSEYDMNVGFIQSWSDTVEALINVILIDFIFISTHENIDTLHWALRVIDRLGSIPMKSALFDQVQNEIRTPLSDKIYMMFRQIVSNNSCDTSEVDLQSSIIYGESGIEEEINKRKIGLTTNYCCELDENGCFRTGYQFDSMAKIWEVQPTANHLDINKMNEFLKQNYDIRRDFQSIHEEMSGNDPSTFQKIEKYTNDKLSQLTVSFLYRAIHYVDRYSVDENDTSLLMKKCKLMDTILDRLEMLVESYSSCKIVPRKFAYPFLMDYYTSDNFELKPLSVANSALDHTVNEFAGKPVVLFYSAGLRPVNISFLRRLISFQRKRNDDLHEKCRSSQLDDAKNSLRDETVGFVEEHIREQSTNNIKLLGFLGSFIAFVSAGVHSLNTELGVDNFTTLLKAVVSCILAFVVMLNFITLPKDEEIDKYSKSYTASLFFAMIIILVLVFL